MPLWNARRRLRLRMMSLWRTRNGGGEEVAYRKCSRPGNDDRTIAARTTEDDVADDKRDLDWSTVLKRTFEAYIRGEIPNAYGEWLKW